MSWYRRVLPPKRKPLNPFLEIHVHLIDRVAVLNGFISGVALYPQVYQAVSTSNLAGVSTTSFVLILLNNVVWSLYAFHRRLISLLIAALLNVVAAGLLLAALLTLR